MKKRQVWPWGPMVFETKEEAEARIKELGWGEKAVVTDTKAWAIAVLAD